MIKPWALNDIVLGGGFELCKCIYIYIYVGEGGEDTHFFSKTNYVKYLKYKCIQNNKFYFYKGKIKNYLFSALSNLPLWFVLQFQFFFCNFAMHRLKWCRKLRKLWKELILSIMSLKVLAINFRDLILFSYVQECPVLFLNIFSKDC